MFRTVVVLYLAKMVLVKELRRFAEINFLPVVKVIPALI